MMQSAVSPFRLCKRRIYRVHLSAALLPFVRSTYMYMYIVGPSCSVVRLQRQLLSSEEQPALKRDRQQRIHDLVRQLKDGKHMSSLRDLAGLVHSSPKKVAALLKEYWLGVTSRGGGGAEEEDCDRYLHSLPK